MPSETLSKIARPRHLTVFAPLVLVAACGGGGSDGPVVGSDAGGPPGVDWPAPSAPVDPGGPPAGPAVPDEGAAPVGTPGTDAPERAPENRALAIAIAPRTDALLDDVVPTADADRRGMWRGPFDWPLVAIHATLLPTGKVASFGTPLASTALQGARLFDVWDPARGTDLADHRTVPNVRNVDSFCSSGTWLASGELLLAGGNSTYDSVILDTEAQVATRTPKFSSERWYSTVLTLADGRPLVLGGGDYYNGAAFQNPASYDDGQKSDANDGVAMTPEVFTADGTWRRLEGATSRAAFGPDKNRYFYPRAWVAPDGLVFGLSSDHYWRLDPDGKGGDGSIEILGTFHPGISEATLPNIGPSSSAVMYAPGKILQTGGNGYTNGANSATDVTIDHRTTSSPRATVFDLGAGSVPVVTDVASMRHPRQWHDVTVLPDGRVLATGGTRYSNYGGAQAVRIAEAWDPAADAWTELAPAQRFRLYHSTSLLLENGVVLTAGGGVPGPVTNLDAEFFLPPYLFERDNGEVRLARRPTVKSVSARRLAHGDVLKMQLAADARIAEVALIALGNVTHSNNGSQRRLAVDFAQADHMLEVRMPAGGSAAPPGYYLVFVLDARGVPSIGVTISLGFGGT